jgi:hypothetical protein
MPARDIYHSVVVHALMADGWNITHDPLSLSYGGKDLYIDLGAERVTIAAEREGQKIAVEIKSFLVYDGLFTERFGQLLLKSLPLRLLVFDEHQERIIAWIP